VGLADSCLQKRWSMPEAEAPVDDLEDSCGQRRRSMPEDILQNHNSCPLIDSPDGDESPLPKRAATFSDLLHRRFKGTKKLKALAVETASKERRIKSLGEDKIYDLFKWEHVIQESGDGGKVVVCRWKSRSADPGKEDKELILKICKKEELRSINRWAEPQYRRVQQRLLNFPCHPGVMPLHEVFEDANYYYTVMEKADGGALFQGLLKEFPDGVIPAVVIKRLMRQILEALGHIHGNGMLHRDIKPDNIVMLKGIPTIIDFDHADPDWNPGEAIVIDTFYGTVHFSAPETFRGQFSQQSDIYSVGVVLYLLMTGKLPRDHDVLNIDGNVGDKRWGAGVFKKLKQESIVDWQCDPWPKNPACKDFCQRLLGFFPWDRPGSAEEALAHEWLVNERID